MRLLDAAATRSALPFDRLIPALHAAFAAGADVPARHHHALPSGATLLLMPAWRPDWMGVKIVSVHPCNAAAGLPAVHATYLLSSTSTGQPVALLDGDVLTARRTAAASALAASFLARPDASRLLLVGAGRVAALVAPAMRVVRGITDVAVWNPGDARGDTLVTDLRSQGFDARRVPDLDAAIAEADIVSCATLATTPLIHGALLRPGMHLDLIGAFTPAMQEADDAAVARASVWIDTEAALHECGELGSDPAVAGTLAMLCQGVPGRRSADEITLFKSVGTALEDLAAAILVQQSQRVLSP